MGATFRVTLLLLFIIFGAFMLTLSGCSVSKTKTRRTYGTVHVVRPLINRLVRF